MKPVVEGHLAPTSHIKLSLTDRTGTLFSQSEIKRKLTPL